MNIEYGQLTYTQNRWILLTEYGEGNLWEMQFTKAFHALAHIHQEGWSPVIVLDPESIIVKRRIRAKTGSQNS